MPGRLQEYNMILQKLNFEKKVFYSLIPLNFFAAVSMLLYAMNFV